MNRQSNNIRIVLKLNVVKYIYAELLEEVKVNFFWKMIKKHEHLQYIWRNIND